MFEKFKKTRLASGLVLALVLSLALGAGSVQAKDFDDINSHWAELNMARGIELGWIRGYEDGTVRPQGTISRAEFVSLILQSLDLEGVEETEVSSYHDIDALAWAGPKLRQAEALGLLDYAFGQGDLMPGVPIARDEALALLDYGLALSRGQDRQEVREVMEAKASAALDPSALFFVDRDSVKPGLIASIRDLVNSGIVSGYEDRTLRPRSQLSRAESMTLLVKARGEEPQALEVQEVQAQEAEGGQVLLDAATGQVLRRSNFKGGMIETKDNKYVIGFDGLAGSKWLEEGHKVFYIDGGRGLARGWKQVGDKLYYFSPYDSRMYKGGIFSTGEGAYWFGKDGGVRSGRRPGGAYGKKVSWGYPPARELENHWLEGADQDLRFRGQEIANFAAAHEGLPFRWYGTDLTNGKGVYCCGNTYSAHKEFGIKIPGPDHSNMKHHGGYEMVRAQYHDYKAYNGVRFPSDFSQAWPGDLVFMYSPRHYLGNNHTGLFLGHNDGRPMYIHATLAGGLIAEDCWQMARDYGYKKNAHFVRYNTPENGSFENYPEVKNR